MASEESGVRRFGEGISDGQNGSGEVFAEWRSSEQVENGTPSTSLPYWDSDDDNDGVKPCNLYGNYTWKIEKFSQIKRELRSSAFDAGGYKWYILIYPQGCDVCNHLSLFLCVANHDKLLPGWSHFAQFTIAVVNKDPKKTKHSDTLHRFWKKEHDWGWKKFMELSKVLDGFLEDDTLTIKAQVQVIREKADRPFRCLDRRYRRELVRVYMANVEQICRCFMEERRNKLVKVLEDKSSWSSFCAFWLGMDQNARHHMSREKTDVVLKVVVKQFFIEKEVTSTLVMDSLYSGLKALEDQNKEKKGSTKLLGSEEILARIIHVEKGMFVLVEDIISLLERARTELLPPKDELGPQNCKDGNPGEDSEKDFTERDERQLTELGRKTLETFVLSHIFSNKIEVAYQEAIALKRQEELIREEEAAWRAESEQKAKRGMSDKEKKSKKKQIKHRRNNRKGKERGKEEKPGTVLQNKHHLENISHEKKDFVIEQAQGVLEKLDPPETVSDVSDSVECVTEVLQLDSDDRDASPVNWDTDSSEVHPLTVASSSVVGHSVEQNGSAVRGGALVMGDSSSTCSTDSFPSGVINGSHRGNFFSNYRNLQSASRGNNHQEKISCGGNDRSNEVDSRPSLPATDACIKAAESKPETISLRYKEKKAEQNTVKREFVFSLQSDKNPIDMERHSKEQTTILLCPPSSPCNPHLGVQPKTDYSNAAVSDPITVSKARQSGPQQFDKLTPLRMSYQHTGLSKAEIQKAAGLGPTKKPIVQAVPAISRPSSAPIIPASRPNTPMVSVVQSAPLLARSVSAAGRLGPDPSPATHSYIPQSYKNAIMGSIVNSGSTSHPTPGADLTPPHGQSASLVCAPIAEHQRINSNSISNSNRPGFPFGVASCEALQKGPRWMETSQRVESRDTSSDQYFFNEIPSLELYKYISNGSQGNSTGFSACTSGRQMLADEFPHLDIINDLLDDEQNPSKATTASTIFQSQSNQTSVLNRQFSYPGEMGLSGDTGSSTNSCRFERPRNYQEDCLPRGSSSVGGLINSRAYNQAGSLPYVNGQIDGLIPYQQIAGSEISLHGMRNTEVDGCQYYNSEYTNLACGVDGYPLYRPAGGQ